MDIKYIVSATVRPVEDQELEVLEASLVTAGLNDAEVIAEVKKARPSPVVNGQPRMLHVSAWIAHEGPNDNGDAFVAEELKSAVEERRLFSNGFGGILDFNHDLEPRGYWYSAEYAFDTNANKYGILAHGAVWAWRFSALTDEMLAEQTRNGHVKVYMMALSDRIELVAQNGKQISIVHDPVFVGASLLNVRPGDPDADGIVAETPHDSTEDQRRQQLKAATLQEDEKMEDLLNQILAALPGLGDDVTEKVTAAFEAKVAEVKAALDAKAVEVAEVQAQLDTATARVEELETLVAERDLSIETARESAEQLTARVAELETELNELKEAEAVRAAEALREARYMELPESVRERVAARTADVQEKMKARWASLSDDEWTAVKEELSLNTETSPRHRLPGVSETQGRRSLKDFV